VADSPRIEELKRRVHSDPASIAFAALAEEYRRAGRFDEAIETCTTGLVRHPSYLSAHVTLGRALIEVGRLQDAREELEYVLKLAPENLAAIRGLAEIHHRIGEEGVDTVVEPPTAPPAEPAPAFAVGETREMPLERPSAIPFKRQTEEKPQPVAQPSPPATPVVAASIVPSMEMPAPSEPHLSYPGPVDPALAGLEEFLNAIIRARAARADAR
jgi:tetratricopeptide (TPR) repeat protein